MCVCNAPIVVCVLELPYVYNRLFKQKIRLAGRKNSHAELLTLLCTQSEREREREREYTSGGGGGCGDGKVSVKVILFFRLLVSLCVGVFDDVGLLLFHSLSPLLRNSVHRAYQRFFQSF